MQCLKSYIKLSCLMLNQSYNTTTVLICSRLTVSGKLHIRESAWDGFLKELRRVLSRVGASFCPNLGLAIRI